MKVEACEILMGAVAFAVVSVTGFAAEDSAAASEAKLSSPLPITNAVAELEPIKGHFVSGTATFEKQDGGVYVIARLQGLTPGFYHGVYLLTTGDCNPPEASSADDHADPNHKSKGRSNPEKRYLGVVVGDANGNGQDGFLVRKTTLEGPNSIIGRAVAVYEKDLGSTAVPHGTGVVTKQPTRDPGARIACGVITTANE